MFSCTPSTPRHTHALTQRQTCAANSVRSTSSLTHHTHSLTYTTAMNVLVSYHNESVSCTHSVYVCVFVSILATTQHCSFILLKSSGMLLFSMIQLSYRDFGARGYCSWSMADPHLRYLLEITDTHFSSGFSSDYRFSS